MIKKRILFVLPSLTMTNGVAKFVYNYLSKIDLSLFEISILASNLRPSKMYLDFYAKNNITIFYTDLLSEVGFFKWHKQIKNIFRINHSFDIVYSNVANQSYFIFKEAKKYGIYKFALHAHATVASDNKIKNIINKFLTSKVIKMVKYRFACGNAAGEFVFKNKDFVVVPNSIEYGKFEYNELVGNEIKEKYCLLNKKIIGFVGRFSPQKNIYFFEKLAMHIPDDFVIMMIGEGKQKIDFIKRIELENLREKFVFVDETPDVYKYYSCFDYFLLPSLYEGLPVVGIEAQINGLVCLFSNSITEEVKITDRAFFLDVKNLNDWVNNLKPYNRKEVLLNSNYDIEIQSKIFEKRLLEL